ncbi:MAG: hypothetical protein KGQ70_07490 [Alphaproteobacteria bacterium]|nr:hypothetical protein [Alphaproteobacteria bacterium]
MITKTFDASHVDMNSVAVISEDILHNGNPGVSLTIPYLRGHYAAAVRMGAAYKRAFAAAGVSHFSAAPVRVDDQQDTRNAVLSYEGLVVLQASSCARLPGNEGSTSIKDAQDYQYGCEMQAEIGKMVSNPADLLGRAPRTQYNSRRNGAIIEPYMNGTPNKPLQGLESSTVGSSSGSGG